MKKRSIRDRVPKLRASTSIASHTWSEGRSEALPSVSQAWIDRFDRTWHRRLAANYVRTDRARDKKKMEPDHASKLQRVIIRILSRYKTSLIERQRGADWDRFLEAVDLPKEALNRLR